MEVIVYSQEPSHWGSTPIQKKGLRKQIRSLQVLLATEPEACETLSREYITNRLIVSRNLLVLVNKDGQTKGFATLYFHPGALILTLLCSWQRGGGRLLWSTVVRAAAKAKLPRIIAQPTEGSDGFYARMGMKKTPEGDRVFTFE